MKGLYTRSIKIQILYSNIERELLTEEGAKEYLSGLRAANVCGLIDLVNNTDLNSWSRRKDIGDIMMPLDVDNEITRSICDYINPEDLMTTLPDNQIYPIARWSCLEFKAAMERPVIVSEQRWDGMAKRRESLIHS